MNTVDHNEKKFILNKYLACYLLLIFLFGFFYCLRGSDVNGVKSWVDAFYFSVVTASTLGFGDMSPAHWSTKLLVSLQVLVSVVLVGLFLNSLSFAQSERIRINERDEAGRRKEQMRDGLDRHVSLLVEALKTSNPMIWDKHAINCAPLVTYKEYIYNLRQNLKINGYELDPLMIKTLLECSDQMYDSFVALLPVAADISPDFLMRWSSFVSNVRNLKGQYDSVLLDKDPTFEWPQTSSISGQLDELLSNAIFLSETLNKKPVC